MVLMDVSESQVLQSLDTFWFFTNIFSCPSKTQNHVVIESQQTRACEREREQLCIEKEDLSTEESKPISQNIEIDQIGSLGSGVGTPMCLKCGENQNQGMEVVESPSPRPRSEGKRSGARRRSKRRSRSNHRREVFGELDLGMGSYGGVKVGSCWANWMLLDEVVEGYVSCGNSPRFGGQNLPPLNVNDNDGEAMKEHLKSWAYAVACTVK